MTRLRIVAQQHRPVRTGVCLQQRRHLARVEWRDTGIPITGQEKHGGIFRPRLNVLVRRVSVKVFELGGIVG